MADRLASFSDLKQFLKGGESIDTQSEKGAALNFVLDSASRRMATYILKSPNYRLAQLASDGISSPTEFYGIEHYGLQGRNIIRLKRPPVAAIVAIIDNDTTLTSDMYTVDSMAGIIYRNVGKFFKQRRAVQVIYTGGYPSNGKPDADAVALCVPDDLKNAACEQCAHEFMKREPGGIPYGVTTISRPDGSILVPSQPWLDSVKAVLDYYRAR